MQGTRRVPVQYARRIIGNKQYGGVRQYIPLKVNAAGVMPIIFAQAIMMVPMLIAGFRDQSSGFVVTFSNIYGFWYNLVTAILIIAFTYFYTAITINPVQMAEDMKKNGGFIPGIKPGRKTVEFFDMIMSRITLPGSIFLAIIAILPSIAVIAGVSPQFAQFYGGTSLLDPCGSRTRHPAADRKPPAYASLRRSYEIGPCERQNGCGYLNIISINVL